MGTVRTSQRAEQRILGSMRHTELGALRFSACGMLTLWNNIFRAPNTKSFRKGETFREKVIPISILSQSFFNNNEEVLV